MTKLVWNQVGERFYETGVDRGVLYPKPSGLGTPWNGLISVEESSSGGNIEPLYYDGVKYLDLVAAEDFQATLQAYSAPKAFAACDGSKTLSPGLFATQQPRVNFGLSYRTLIGNDLVGNDKGYKLHLVYNATAAPSSTANQTVTDTVSPGTKQWTIQTVPERSTTYKPTAHLIVDSTLADPAKLTALENILYGTSTVNPSLPLQSTVVALLA